MEGRAVDEQGAGSTVDDFPPAAKDGVAPPRRHNLVAASIFLDTTARLRHDRA